MLNREKTSSVPKRGRGHSATHKSMMRVVHEALDLVECCLGAMPLSEDPELIDLVLQLRRRIIETYKKSGSGIL